MTPERFKAMIRDRSFTSEEVIAFTGVDKFTFRNWLKRGVVEMGEKHRLGRWLFSPVDMIRVSAMVDLVENIGMSPSAASGLCDEVVKLLDTFVEASIANRKEGVRTSPLLAPLDHYLIVAIVAKDKVSYRHAIRQGDLIVFGDEEKQDAGLLMLRVTHVVLAAGLIIDDMLEKVKAALDERKA
ncbi:hypothetical protein NKH17_06750 [Mesorhizobium sp. M1334]|uniref:MerR family transcriptional regulator n=1 Tax=Mesorhizobium sp. M1334 TaxID=2957084 RepID=UPI00333CB3BB